MKVIKNSEIEYYRHKTLDSDFTGVVFCYKSQVIYLNSINKNTRGYLILPEILVTNQMVFYLPENHYMAELFYMKIDWFREFGITNHATSIFIDSLYESKIHAGSTREPISLKELYAVFMIYLGGLVVAMAAFLFEKCFSGFLELSYVKR